MSFLDQSIVAVIPISEADTDFAGGQIPQLGGRALLEYTFRAARESRLTDRLIVSTDSARIAEACKASGIDAPFVRPPELANPNVPITRVLRYTLEWLSGHEQVEPDWIAMLSVTYPFRPKGFIDTFIQTVLSEDLDSAFAATEERQSHWALREDAQPELVSFGSDIAKADKRPLFRELSGLMSMAKRETILAGKLYGKKLAIIPTHDARSTVNIHDPLGQQFAELLAPRFLESD
jgi:N-acylneuraminate cytidylyltransferase